MRNLLGMFALLSSGIPAMAQAPAQGASTVLLLSSYKVGGCPVGLEARHGQNGGMLSVGPAKKLPQQSYRILFFPAIGETIMQAKITLHGLAGGQVIPVAEQSKADATESFNLSLAVGTKHLYQSTIYTEKLTGVQWVELNELTYADGTKWHESDAASCRVAPNGFMLVAGTH